jgi:hypothetical protein
MTLSSHQAGSQGLKHHRSQGGEIFHVTMVRLCSKAVAAINPSGALTANPRSWHWPSRTPKLSDLFTDWQDPSRKPRAQRLVEPFSQYDTAVLFRMDREAFANFTNTDHAEVEVYYHPHLGAIAQRAGPALCGSTRTERWCLQKETAHRSIGRPVD